MIKRLKEFRMPLPILSINNTDDQMALPPNMLVDVLNMEFERAGAKTRPGYIAYSTSGLPSNKFISGGYVFKKSDGSKYLLIASDVDLYKEGATGVFSSIKSGLTTGNYWSFVSLANLAIGMDGLNAPLKFDGTTCKNLEVVAPTIAPSATVGVAGNLTGNYQYKVTFVSNSGAETNTSGSSVVVSPSSQKI